MFHSINHHLTGYIIMQTNNLVSFCCFRVFWVKIIEENRKNYYGGLPLESNDMDSSFVHSLHTGPATGRADDDIPSRKSSYASISAEKVVY